MTFLGIVRNDARDGRAVVGLSYEAYESMACNEFEAIDAQARERFGDVRLWIAHAVGDLAVGEVAVAVAAAADVYKRQRFLVLTPTFWGRDPLFPNFERQL